MFLISSCILFFALNPAEMYVIYYKNKDRYLECIRYVMDLSICFYQFCRNFITVMQILVYCNLNSGSCFKCSIESLLYVFWTANASRIGIELCEICSIRKFRLLRVIDFESHQVIFLWFFIILLTHGIGTFAVF